MRLAVKGILPVIMVVLLGQAPALAAIVIDGSSPAAYKSSVSAIKQNLVAEKQPLFEKAAGYYLAAFDFTGGTNSAKAANILANLNGMNAATLVKAYTQVVSASYTAAQKELDEADGYFAKAIESNRAFNAFEIMDTTFYYDESGGKTTPMIGLAVYNASSHVIKQIYLKGEICSVGRIIPWFAEEFNFTAPEGVKPNELADWELATDNAAGWARIPKDDELKINLKIVKLVSDKGLEFKKYPEAKKHDLYVKMLKVKVNMLQEELAKLKTF